MGTTDIAGHEAEVRTRFDQWSHSPTFERLRPWLAAVQNLVLERVDWERTDRLLDVACGSGWAVYEAAGRFEERGRGLAAGCDISIGMLRRRELGRGRAPHAVFTAASAQSLPYEDGAFDTVICTAAFHHFPRPLEALLEFRRVLREGGVILIAETCRDQSLTTWIWDRIHRWFEKGHVKYYRRDELAGLLREAGFGEVRVEDAVPRVEAGRKLARKVAIASGRAPL